MVRALGVGCVEYEGSLLARGSGKERNRGFVDTRVYV